MDERHERLQQAYRRLRANITGVRFMDFPEWTALEILDAIIEPLAADRDRLDYVLDTQARWDTREQIDKCMAAEQRRRG